MQRHPYIVRDEYMRERVADLIRQLDLSKAWQITVAPHRARRSLNQNNLYWKWVGIIAADTGNSDNAVHDALKDEFLPPRFMTWNGKVREYRPSTTELKIDEMSTYMSQVLAWAGTTLGIMLPVPDDLGRVAA